MDTVQSNLVVVGQEGWSGCDLRRCVRSGGMVRSRLAIAGACAVCDWVEG